MKRTHKHIHTIHIKYIDLAGLKAKLSIIFRILLYIVCSN